MSKRIIRRTIVWLALCLSLAGCLPEEPLEPTSTLPPTPSQAPPSLPTVSPSPSASPTVTATVIQPPTITPTVRITASPTFIPIRGDRIQAPILLYHHIAEPGKNRRTYYTSPQQFHAQMEWLKGQGYQTISMATLGAALRGEGDLPGRPVIIAIDDAFEETYTQAYPILEEFGFQATLNVIVNYIGIPPYMNAEMLGELVGAGWEIGSHSRTHADLSKSTDPIAEICASKHDLEELLGAPVLTFAYPYGVSNPYLSGIVKDCGYTTGGGVGPYIDHAARSVFFLSRIPVDGNWTLLDFQAALKGPKGT